MTHEELLKSIEILIADFCEGEYCATCAPYKALRAVIELHAPYGDMMCVVCEGISYPCSTIQAIESELK